MSESREASPPAGLTGWVCRPGYEFGREILEELDAAYEAMPSMAWNGETPISIYGTDLIFYKREDLAAFCSEGDMTHHDLQLVHCEPIPISLVVPAMISPELPEIMLPAIVLAGIDRLNRLLAAHGPFGWQPTEVRVMIVE